MAMLYYVTLAIGGTLVLVSIALGGDHDHDVDAGADASVDAGHAGGFDAMDAWLPFASLRFWTFFAAFFGLTGTLLTSFELGGGAVTVGVLSGAMGYLSGVAVTAVIRKLKDEVVDSAVSSDDLMGEQATVMIPFGKGRDGKVRMNVKDRIVEALATTDEDTEFQSNETAFVYGVKEDGVVLVSRMKRPEN